MEPRTRNTKETKNKHKKKRINITDIIQIIILFLLLYLLFTMYQEKEHCTKVIEGQYIDTYINYTEPNYNNNYLYNYEEQKNELATKTDT